MNNKLIIFMYSAIHLVVDLSCAAFIYHFLALRFGITNIAIFILVYDFLAFVLQLPFGVFFNNIGWLGLLPIILSIQFTICVYAIKSAQHMRIALIINLLLGMIFDFLIKAYPMFALDIIIIILLL